MIKITSKRRVNIIWGVENKTNWGDYVIDSWNLFLTRKEAVNRKKKEIETGYKTARLVKFKKVEFK